jgi:hypothetical protein
MSYDSSALTDMFSQGESHREVICIFRCTSKGLARVNILAHSGGGEAFPKNCISIGKVLSQASQNFLVRSVTSTAASYVLLLTKKKIPLLVVTKTAPYSGVCVAFELKADARTTIAFFKTIPNISLLIDPAMEALPAQRASDPADFARLGLTFRRVFSIFETGEYYQKDCNDPLLAFKLFKLRIQSVAEAFGAEPSYLTQAKFEEPPKKHLSINNALLSLTAIFLFCMLKGSATDPRIHIIFMLVDGCPAVCLHFRGYTDRYKNSPLLYYLRFLFSESSAYFYTGSGEKIQDEAAKIPGIRYIVKAKELLPIGEHILVVFSPVRRDWRPYMNRCPLVTLPDDFYDDDASDTDDAFDTDDAPEDSAEPKSK